jgi:hypothetical protein
MTMPPPLSTEAPLLVTLGMGFLLGLKHALDADHLVAGTIAGMLVMSVIVGLPFALATRTASGLSGQIQLLSAIGSVAFGLWYSYQFLVVEGLLRSF